MYVYIYIYMFLLNLYVAYMYGSYWTNIPINSKKHKASQQKIRMSKPSCANSPRNE